jgi:hypothetical protein
MAMTVARLIPAQTRAALLLGIGFVLLATPVALGLSGAAIVTGIALGIVTTGLGLAGTATEGRGTIPVSMHALYDRALAVGLFLIALLFGATGEASALTFFTVAGIATLALALVTRYSGARTA